MSVRDEGGGIPEELRSRLFQPVASGKEGGSGLGLAISSQLALHLGARLELVDGASGGCWFRLWLPAEAGEFEESMAGDISDAVTGGGRA
jgi:signal transduction histidine kinase